MAAAAAVEHQESEHYNDFINDLSTMPPANCQALLEAAERWVQGEVGQLPGMYARALSWYWSEFSEKFSPAQQTEALDYMRRVRQVGRFTYLDGAKTFGQLTDEVMAGQSHGASEFADMHGRDAFKQVLKHLRECAPDAFNVYPPGAQQAGPARMILEGRCQSGKTNNTLALAWLHYHFCGCHAFIGAWRYTASVAKFVDDINGFNSSMVAACPLLEAHENTAFRAQLKVVLKNDWTADQVAQVAISVTNRAQLENLARSLCKLWVSQKETARHLGCIPLILLMDEDDENAQTWQAGQIEGENTQILRNAKEEALYNRSVLDLIGNGLRRRTEDIDRTTMDEMAQVLFPSCENTTARELCFRRTALADCVYHYIGISATYNATLMSGDHAVELAKAGAKGCVRMAVPSDYYGFCMPLGSEEREIPVEIVQGYEKEDCPPPFIGDDMDVQTVVRAGLANLSGAVTSGIPVQAVGNAVVQLIIPKMQRIAMMADRAINIATFAEMEILKLVDERKLPSRLPIMIATLHGGSTVDPNNKLNKLLLRNFPIEQLKAALEACKNYPDDGDDAIMKKLKHEWDEDALDRILERLNGVIIASTNSGLEEGSEFALSTNAGGLRRTETDDDEEEEEETEEAEEEEDAEPPDVARVSKTVSATDIMNIFLCTLRWVQQRSENNGGCVPGIYAAIVSHARAGRAISFKDATHSLHLTDQYLGASNKKNSKPFDNFTQIVHRICGRYKQYPTADNVLLRPNLKLWTVKAASDNLVWFMKVHETFMEKIQNGEDPWAHKYPPVPTGLANLTRIQVQRGWNPRQINPNCIELCELDLVDTFKSEEEFKDLIHTKLLEKHAEGSLIVSEDLSDVPLRMACSVSSLKLHRSGPLREHLESELRPQMSPEGKKLVQSLIDESFPRRYVDFQFSRVAAGERWDAADETALYRYVQNEASRIERAHNMKAICDKNSWTKWNTRRVRKWQTAVYASWWLNDDSLIAIKYKNDVLESQRTLEKRYGACQFDTEGVCALGYLYSPKIPRAGDPAAKLILAVDFPEGMVEEAAGIRWNRGENATPVRHVGPRRDRLLSPSEQGYAIQQGGRNVRRRLVAAAENQAGPSNARPENQAGPSNARLLARPDASFIQNMVPDALQQHLNNPDILGVVAAAGILNETVNEINDANRMQVD